MVLVFAFRPGRGAKNAPLLGPATWVWAAPNKRQKVILLLCLLSVKQPISAASLFAEKMTAVTA
jgi:hypothetical protein